MKAAADNILGTWEEQGMSGQDTRGGHHPLHGEVHRGRGGRSWAGLATFMVKSQARRNQTKVQILKEKGLPEIMEVIRSVL